MPESDLLGPLLGAIKAVKKRIDDPKHAQNLRENETRTRVALIDPILSALGWDVSDPSKVTPEFPVSAGRADYALLSSAGNALVALEAKKLGESLAPHRQQMVNYANTAGIGYAGLTDGDNWEVYRVFTATPLPLSERIVMSTSIRVTEPHESALKLLALWGTNVGSGEPQEAGTPIVGLPETKAETEATGYSPTVEGLPATNTNKGEVALADFVPVPGSKPPVRIRFPDGSIRRLTYWKSILIESIDWAFASDESRVDEGPIDYGHGGLINNRPLQKSGKPMASPYKIRAANLFVETHGSAATIVTRSKAILRKLEVDTAKVLLYVED